jgi:hypothetical protein
LPELASNSVCALFITLTRGEQRQARPGKGGATPIKLLTKALLKRLPALYSQEDNPDPLVVCKFFTPDAGWTWYAMEGSPVDANGYYDTDQEKVDFVFFGLVSGVEVELGYFSLAELKSIRGNLGLPVERDLSFTPTRLSAVKTLCGYTR